MLDKRQYVTLNESYALGWTLDHWKNDTAIITHDVLGFDLFAMDSGAVLTAYDYDQLEK